MYSHCCATIVRWTVSGQRLGKHIPAETVMQTTTETVAGFQQRRPGFKPGSSHLGFVVNKVALGQFFSEYFGLPCQSSAGTIGQ
jgi:hypothetical protein